MNRLFLHPLGLAAEVLIDVAVRIVGDSEFESLEGCVLRIQDHRDDPEGVMFAESTLDLNKIASFKEMQMQRHDVRLQCLGFVVQASPDEIPFRQCKNPDCPVGCPDSHALLEE